MDWARIEAPSIDEFEHRARKRSGRPANASRAMCGDIPFAVQEFPDDDVIADMDLESEFDILGLFQGDNLAAREGRGGRPEPTMIFLYRRPILDYWAEHQGALGDIVRHVIIHEIGHHFGLSDEDMEEIENG